MSVLSSRLFANVQQPRIQKAGLIDCNCMKWSLVMRTIKCLKGVWWMPWYAQAMKDVIRCDKRRGAANKL